MAFRTLIGGRPIEREDPVFVTVKADAPAADLSDGASRRDEFETLPRRRCDADIGALYLLSFGLVVTPLERASDTTWHVRVVIGIDRYPVGGYDLAVSTEELEVAREIKPTGSTLWSSTTTPRDVAVKTSP